MPGRRKGFGGHLVSLREQQKGRPAQISTDSQYRKEQNGTTMDNVQGRSEKGLEAYKQEEDQTLESLCSSRQALERLLYLIE